MMKKRALWLLFVAAFGLCFNACQQAAITPDLTATLGGNYNLSRLLAGPTALAATGSAVVTVVNKSTIDVKITVKSSSGNVDITSSYQVAKEDNKYLLKEGANQTVVGNIVDNLLTLQIVIGTIRYTGEFTR